MSKRKWDWRVRAATMSDADLAAELVYREKEWDDMRAALDECGGMSGSPGEWLAERMEELEHEQKRRVAAA